MESRHRLPPVLLARAREMRHEMVTAEKKLWHFLRDRRLNGFKFRRQQVMGRYIADFFCAEAKLIVELDGDSHAMREAYDDQRSRWLRAQGHFVARYWNHDVQRDLIAVLESILRHCCDGSARD